MKVVHMDYSMGVPSRPPQHNQTGCVTALRCWATPEDIADVIVSLGSVAPRFLTGEAI